MIEPPEAFHLREHMRGRAIDVRIADRAALESLAEIPGHTGERRRVAGGERGQRKLLLLRRPGAHGVDEIGDLLVRHGGLVGLLAERKKCRRPGARLFHVHPAADEFSPVRRAPVGSHESPEPVLAAQDLIDRLVVTAGIGAVDLAVGTHDGGYAGIDDGLEGRQVHFAQRLAVDERVVGAVVGDEVLGLRHDARGLRRDHELRGECPRQYRVLTERVVGAFPGGIAVHVDERLQDDVDAERARITADERAIGRRLGATEGRRHGERGGHPRRFVTHQHAGWPIRKAQVRYTQPRHTAGPARLALEYRVGFLRAADDAHFFFARHLRE